MAQTKYDICSRALTRVGANPIASFDDGTTEAIVAGREYEPLVQARLAIYPFRFAMEMKALNKLGDTPADKWAYAYQLPSDLVKLRAVRRDGVNVAYERFGDKIFTDEDDDLTAEYTFRQIESRWPAYFTEALTTDLAAIFALSLNRDRELSSDLRALADGTPMKPGLWDLARLADSQQQTTQRLPTGRLVAVRR